MHDYEQLRQYPGTFVCYFLAICGQKGSKLVVYAHLVSENTNGYFFLVYPTQKCNHLQQKKD